MSGLVKDFGKFRALDGLDLSVRAGEVHGFLGPNGSGKSTTIRVLLGMLRATAGEVRLLGGDPWADATELHRRLAYVPGDVNLWPQLTGGETIDLLGRLRGGSRRATAARRCSSATTSTRPRRGGPTPRETGRRSPSSRRSPATSSCWCSTSRPRGSTRSWRRSSARCVDEERDRGRTVLLSSHILSEVESLCDRVSIIRSGRTVETGTLAEMRHLTETSVDVTVTGPPPSAAELPDVRDLEVDGHRLRFLVPTARLGATLEVLGRRGIESLVSQPPTLEQLFLRHYDREPAAP